MARTSLAQGTPKLPDVINSLDLYGHSYFDNWVQGGANNKPLVNDDFMFGNNFAYSVGLSREKVRNHAVTSVSLTLPGQGGFAKVLREMQGQTTQSAPFARGQSGMSLFAYGINDIGNNTAANQATLRATAQNCWVAVISKARASAIYLAASPSAGTIPGTQWSFGANFTASSHGSGTADDWSSGHAAQATVVDSAGSTTATFTIPVGYQGEAICFCMTALAANTLVVTFGGTVTGTTGIVGKTVTLGSVNVSTSAQCAYGVRFTAAANGFSAANAGQTITIAVTTISGATFYLDGAWIEANKPPPVLVCNVPRLPCVTYTLQFGDGVTTGVNTSFTSATAGFVANGVNGGTANYTDVGSPILELDAQGAISNSLTVSSVTNATTIVLSGNAAAAKTSIKFQISRFMNGYGIDYSTNTNFSGATAANHTAADNDVLNWNTMLQTVVAQFDSMVQIVNLDTAFGQGDQAVNLPSNVTSLFVLADGLHPNSLGAQRAAQACFNAASALAPAADLQPLGTLETASTPIWFNGPDRRVIVNNNQSIGGQYYLPEYQFMWNSTTAPFTGGPAAYTAVAGDVFAMPFFITEHTCTLNACNCYQINAPASAGSNVRVGWYDDPSCVGYPQMLRSEVTSGGAFALGTTSGVKSIGQFSVANFPVHYGLNWLVVKIDSLGTTASQLTSIMGPSKYLPNFNSAGGSGAVPFGPIAWKLTGVGAGALPGLFPIGAALASVAPAFGVQIVML